MCKWIASILAALSLVAAGSTAAYAGPYAGASWGAWSVDESELDENDDLWKAYGGWQGDLLGVEATWVDFSHAGTGTQSFEADGWGLSAVLSFPVGRTTSLFAKAGQFWWDSRTVLGGVASSPDGNDPFYGVGLKFGGPIALRLEWERFDIADVDVDTYSIGVQIGF
ncbi:MAG TPA: outer membrane beta-barrel protein [Burkholderiales bacterium]